MNNDSKQSSAAASCKQSKSTFLFLIFPDIFGSRVGRVSPRIREIQEQLRRAQRRAALRKFDEDGNYVCPVTTEDSN